MHSYIGKPGAASGGCFHSALHTWQELGAPWLVAIGVVHNGIGQPHLHAWLEAPGGRVYSPVSGAHWRRPTFYAALGIEPATVRLISPRGILRTVGRRRIERDGVPAEAVRAMLDRWGKWRVVDGGVMPA